jgi:prevent-host-death family protein
MKTVPLSEAKAHLSSLLRRVARGEVVVILSRGRPVARLGPPLESERGADSQRLAELEQDGVLLRGQRRPSLGFLDLPVPKARADLLGALLAEREEGR